MDYDNIKLMPKTKKVLKCFKRQCIARIKTHTSNADSSGTDANIRMTFGLYNKKNGELEHQCQPIHLNNQGKQMGWGQIGIFEISHLGK